MSETLQGLSRSCLTIAIVVGIFLCVLLILGVGVALYSLQAGSI